MEKSNSLNFIKNLMEIKLNHYRRMIPIASMGSIYSKFLSSTDDEGLNEILNSLAEDLDRINIKIDNYLFGSLLVTTITEVELFLTDMLFCVIKEFPKKIKNMKFEYNDIVDKSNDEIIQIASQRYINELMYKKPLDYFKSFCEITSIDFEEPMKYWPNFIEAKARRDLGIHNNWIANEVYFRKLEEVNIAPIFSLGESVHPDNAYVGRVYDNCLCLIDSIGKALVAKFSTKS